MKPWYIFVINCFLISCFQLYLLMSSSIAKLTWLPLPPRGHWFIFVFPSLLPFKMIPHWELSFLLIPKKFSGNCLLGSKVTEGDRQIGSVTSKLHQLHFLVLEVLLKIWMVIGKFFYPFLMCLWFNIKSLTHWHSQDTVMDYSANTARSKHSSSSEAACLH